MPGTAADGELTWVEQRDCRLVVIQNLDPALAESVAAAAFGPARRGAGKACATAAARASGRLSIF